MDTNLMASPDMTRSKSLDSAEVFFKDSDEDGATGEIRAIFSKFGVEDRDGDIVSPGAFKHNQQVPMVWHHQWGRPVGKGKIVIEDDVAIFEGKFFLDTADGMEAYKTVKNMGRLQQYSVGFRILKAVPKDPDVDVDENPYWWLDGVRIDKAEVFEVSPVLVGANQHTRTLAIKGVDSPFDPSTIAVPRKGMTFVDEAEAALAAANAFVQRASSLAELRAKDGRDLSLDNLERITQFLGSLREMEKMLSNLVGTGNSEPEIEEQADTVEAAAREKRFAMAQRTAALFDLED